MVTSKRFPFMTEHYPLRFDPMLELSFGLPIPGYARVTAARTRPATGFPDERARALAACARSSIGYEPEPGAFSGMANSPRGILRRAEAVKRPMPTA